MRYSKGATSGMVVAGGNGPGINDTQLYSPTGIYLDTSTDSLYIANRDAHNIICWRLGDTRWKHIAGNLNGLSGITQTQFNWPWDVTLDPMGNVYVVDRSNSRLQFFLSGQSNATTIAGVRGVTGTSANLFNLPYSLSFDSQLNIYVADTFNLRIQKFLRY